MSRFDFVKDVDNNLYNLCVQVEEKQNDDIDVFMLKCRRVMEYLVNLAGCEGKNLNDKIWNISTKMYISNQLKHELVYVKGLCNENIHLDNQSANSVNRARVIEVLENACRTVIKNANATSYLYELKTKEAEEAECRRIEKERERLQKIQKTKETQRILRISETEKEKYQRIAAEEAKEREEYLCRLAIEAEKYKRLCKTSQEEEAKKLLKAREEKIERRLRVEQERLRRIEEEKEQERLRSIRQEEEAKQLLKAREEEEIKCRRRAGQERLRIIREDAQSYNHCNEKNTEVKEPQNGREASNNNEIVSLCLNNKDNLEKHHENIIATASIKMEQLVDKTETVNSSSIKDNREKVNTKKTESTKKQEVLGLIRDIHRDKKLTIKYLWAAIFGAIIMVSIFAFNARTDNEDINNNKNSINMIQENPSNTITPEQEVDNNLTLEKPKQEQSINSSGNISKSQPKQQPVRTLKDIEEHEALVDNSFLLEF